MRRFRFSFLLAGLMALAAGQPLLAGGAKDFLPSDLSGWEGLVEYWTYKDGVLVGSTLASKGLKFNTFLCSKKKYADFELSFQIRLKNGDGNSGVQIRSKVFDRKHFAVAGPQCDIGQIYWASLYGEHIGGMMKQAPQDLVKKILKPKDFNDYSIKCVADHVIIKLNGQVTVDGVFPKMPRQGIIAWQLHAGGPMEVTFKNIRFKDLGGVKGTGEKLPPPKEVVIPPKKKPPHTEPENKAQQPVSPQANQVKFTAWGDATFSAKSAYPSAWGRSRPGVSP